MRTSLSGFVASVLLFCGSLTADIPKIISYQGAVTDTNGTPVFDGSYNMAFSIYDAAWGGTALWNSGTVSVQVTSGIFNVILGVSPQDSIDLPFDEDYWLQVTVESDVQLPRQQLGSVGYSYTASGLVPGTEVSGEVLSGLKAIIAGSNTATTSNSCGLYGESSSTGGYGVYGVASSSSGMSFGVYGRTTSTQGCGVSGYANVTTGLAIAGHYLTYAPYGTGLYSESMATDGSNEAVWGNNMATEGTTHGVRGTTRSTEGWGVWGEALAESGDSHGVYGRTYSITGNAVRAYASATAGPTYGVYARALSNTEATGVYGWTSAGSGEGWGVWGQTSSNNPNAYGVYYSGGLGGTGLMTNLVRTPEGAAKLYCQASSECWFEDFGEGELANGTAHVDLDPLFLSTVTIDQMNPMHVFIQLHDAGCEGVAVERGTDGFDVLELRQGRSTASFSYRVVAKRKGFEEDRLEISESARRDPYLYPEVHQEKFEQQMVEQAEKDRRCDEERTRFDFLRPQRSE